jgi:hypothetical protein
MADWASDTCGYCGFHPASGTLTKTTCESCGMEGCAACGPKPGAPEGARLCRKCYLKKMRAATAGAVA